jgi:hypothetical protein
LQTSQNNAGFTAKLAAQTPLAKIMALKIHILVILTYCWGEILHNKEQLIFPPQAFD